MLIAFTSASRKIIKFEIDGRIIRYFDDLWQEGIQIMPKDQELIDKLNESGQENLKIMAKLIVNSNRGQDLKDYEACETEEDLANFVRKDCLNQGLMEV